MKCLVYVIIGINCFSERRINLRDSQSKKCREILKCQEKLKLLEWDVCSGTIRPVHSLECSCVIGFC